MKNYNLHPKVLLRTPLLPLDGPIRQIFSCKDSAGQIAQLKEAFQHAATQEALFLASPVLYAQMKKWLEGEISDPHDLNSLHLALMRYLSRMSSRCTPFGLFAGCTMGEWGKQQDIVLDDLHTYRRHTRPDMDYMGNLTQRLSKTEGIREYLRFFPNNSLYFNADKYRYIDYYYHQKRRIHQISTVDANEYVERVLQKAKNGSTISELANSLVSDDISFEEAYSFVTEMVETQLLVSELDGNTTGDEMFERLLGSLQRISTNSGLAAQCLNTLEGLKKALAQIDQKSPGVNAGTYEFIAQSLQPLDTAYEMNRLFQTDMIKPAASCTLNQQLAGTIRRALDLINRIHTKPAETELSRFLQAFEERYETKEVPLLEVLDVETGIGYIQNGEAKGDLNPLVDDLALAPQEEGSTNIQWNKRQAFLLTKLVTALSENQYAIELQDTDVQDFEPNWEDLPDSLYAMGNLLHPGPENGGLLASLDGASGSATLILGRFTHADPAIHEWVKDIADREQALYPEDTILAEICHLPEARTGNVLMRTAFRPYEIPYLAQGGVAPESQIMPDDLMLSIRNGELVLRSRRLNKRILPRLGNAHNYSANALPVYHFLCDLQNQGKRSGMGFSWGALSEQFKFLPRVTYQNILLHRASWKLKKSDYEDLLKAKEVDLLHTIGAWRQKWKIPQHIVVIEFDNELLIDLDNILSIKVLVQELKNRTEVQFAEFIFSHEGLAVKDKAGASYTNQFIAVFSKKEQQAQKSAIENHPKTGLPDAHPVRTLPIGSEWLYFKCYCGASTADDILCDIIRPLAKRLQKKGLIDHWFFIRYMDPKWHLRVRFHLCNEMAVGPVIQAVHKAVAAAVSQKQIWRIQVDTYEREMERYGPLTIGLAEQVFYEDSRTTLDFLHKTGRNDPEARWLYGLFSMESILNAFGFSPARKTALLKRLKDGFGAEFNMGSVQWKQLNKKFQTASESIKNCADNSPALNPAIRSVRKALKEKEAALLPIAQKLLATRALDEQQLDDVMASFLHMLHNRLFKSKQRMHEMVLYDFLSQVYRTQNVHQRKEAVLG